MALLLKGVMLENFTSSSMHRSSRVKIINKLECSVFCDRGDCRSEDLYRLCCVIVRPSVSPTNALRYNLLLGREHRPIAVLFELARSTRMSSCSFVVVRHHELDHLLYDVGVDIPSQLAGRSSL